MQLNSNRKRHHNAFAIRQKRRLLIYIYILCDKWPTETLIFNEMEQRMNAKNVYLIKKKCIEIIG